MKRKEFIKRTALIAISGAPLVSIISSCGGDDSTTTPVDELSCIDNGTDVAISGNHGHALTISKDVVNKGGERVFSIQGSSQHNHLVTIKEEDFEILRNNSNAAIRVETTSDSGHVHTITVRCAG